VTSCYVGERVRLPTGNFLFAAPSRDPRDPPHPLYSEYQLTSAEVVKLTSHARPGWSLMAVKVPGCEGVTLIKACHILFRPLFRNKLQLPPQHSAYRIGCNFTAFSWRCPLPLTNATFLKYPFCNCFDSSRSSQNVDWLHRGKKKIFTLPQKKSDCKKTKMTIFESLYYISVVVEGYNKGRCWFLCAAVRQMSKGDRVEEALSGKILMALTKFVRCAEFLRRNLCRPCLGELS
jgi:hypothetical protein